MYRKVGTFFSVKDKSRKPKRKLEGRRKKKHGSKTKTKRH